MNGYDNYNYDGNDDLHRNNTMNNSPEGQWNGNCFMNSGSANDGNHRSGMESRKQGKRSGKSNKWVTAIAMALAFGVTAGGAAYGVNYTAGQVFGTAVSGQTSASGDAGSSKTETSGKTTEASLTTAKKSNSLQTTTTSTAGVMSVADVAKEAMPSMVTISTMSVQEMQSFFGRSQSYEVQGAGTGVIIGETDEEILIATNNHVISGAQTVSIGFVDESVVSAAIKGTDAENDLAVVAVKKADVSDSTKEQIKVITVGDSDELQLGEQVVAIGNALGYGQSVTSGYVSALNRDLSMSDGTTNYSSTGLIQTDAAINSGNSGGALLNMKGELIGINEAKSSGGSGEATVDNMGFAIPMSRAQSILKDLMNQKTKTRYAEAERGRLGVNVADVTAEYAKAYNMPEGVCITDVQAGSAADEAGLQQGDVMTKFGDTAVQTASELKEALAYYTSGDTVDVVVQRNVNGHYEEVTVSVTLQ
uniref:S1C family serine protease n=1 Tax=Eubacterium cellulosolvens TaxID=29322 RepID=UPI0006865F15|nr:trypsin-like peptidase domain-containing protein [[Eubacterium] cellulosolvens]